MTFKLPTPEEVLAAIKRAKTITIDFAGVGVQITKIEARRLIQILRSSGEWDCYYHMSSIEQVIDLIHYKSEKIVPCSHCGKTMTLVHDYICDETCRRAQLGRA